MAPTKFQIYVDQSMVQSTAAAPVSALSLVTGAHNDQQVGPPDKPTTHGEEQSKKLPWPRARWEATTSLQRYPFDMNQIYPLSGCEFSFEELRLKKWRRKQQSAEERRRNEEKIEHAHRQITVLTDVIKQLHQQLQQQQQLLSQQVATTTTTTTNHSNERSPPQAMGRLSIVPQSLQPAQGNETTDITTHVPGEPTAVFPDLWKHTLFTVPIDQSQYIRENCATSTPNKGERTSQRPQQQRRMSRPSMSGSPTMKLSPITETSRDCNSKSSSSSSAMSTTPATAKKPLVLEPVENHDPDKPFNLDDPSTYYTLLKALAEPLEMRSGYVKARGSMPLIKNGVCFGSGSDNYLVDKELSKESRIFTAQLLTDDSDSSNFDIPVKTICFRVDQPPNEWLFYVCNELHRRIVRQKIQPDIELSVMNADPAIMYQNGSILVDEYFRYVPLEDYLVVCSKMNKPFPKSVAALLSLELIQLVRGMHQCDIIHNNINTKNIIITSCPTREDITSVDERTSIVKLIDFDRAIDARLLPAVFKYSEEEPRPWRQDWIAILRCIHKMFFLEELAPVQEEDRLVLNRSFKGFPTDVWTLFFDCCLNGDIEKIRSVVEQVTDALRTWIKANTSFVLREAAILDLALEDYSKANDGTR